MISNFFSLALGFIEMFFFSGIAFGFPFIEYIMKEEGIFYDESCPGTGLYNFWFKNFIKVKKY